MQRVDQTERVAKFDDEKILINLRQVKGRSRQSAVQSQNGANISSVNMSASEMSSMLDGGGPNDLNQQ